MRARLAIAAVLAASGALTAQSDINTFGQWDRTTEYTSRATLGTKAGHLSQKHQYGVVAGITHLSRCWYVMQDQQASTQTPYDVGLTGTDNLGLPDYANTVFYSTNIGLPSTSPGIHAWGVTHTFTTPIVVPQDMTGYHHVWRLQADPGWSATDGVSVHMSQGAPYNGTILCYNSGSHREIPRSENNTQIIEGLGWSEVPGGNPSAQAVDRAWRVETSADTPVLEGGTSNSVYNCSGQDPCKGYSSFDPDFADIGSGSPGRFDDPHFTITAGSTYASGVGILFSSQACLPAPIPIFGGQFMLDPTDPMFGLILPTTLDGSGTGMIPINLGTSSNPIRAALHKLPTWHTQAIVVAGANVGLTNLFTMRLQKTYTNDPVFKNANVDAGNALNVTKPTAAPSFYIRNEGSGVITVKQFVGSTQLGATVSVGDHVAVRVPLSPPTQTLKVETTVTKPTTSHSGVDVTYGFY